MRPSRDSTTTIATTGSSAIARQEDAARTTPSGVPGGCAGGPRRRGAPGGLARAGRILLASLVVASAARASTAFIPDSEDGLLAGILAQLGASSITLTNMMTSAQASLETATYTLDTVRKATDVVQDLAYLTTNPDEIWESSQRAFGTTFPELRAIADDVAAIRRNAMGLAPNDPRTLSTLLEHAAQTRSGAYQAVMAFDAARFGLLDPYLHQAKLMADISERTLAIQQAADGALDPQHAAVLSAKADAMTATTTLAVAQSSMELARIEQQRYVAARAVEAAEDAQRRKENAALKDIAPVEDLDPTKLDAPDALPQGNLGGALP